jgi:hypothetical protein
MICWLAGISLAAEAERAWPPEEAEPEPAANCWSPAAGAPAPLATAVSGPAAAGDAAGTPGPATDAEDDAVLPEHPASAALPRTALPMMAIPERARVCRRPRPRLPLRGRREAAPAGDSRGVPGVVSPGGSCRISRGRCGTQPALTAPGHALVTVFPIDGPGILEGWPKTCA